MPLLARTLTVPLVVEIGSGTVGALPELLRDRRISPGGDVAMLIGPGQGEAVVEALEMGADEPRVFLVEDAAVDRAEELATRVRARNFDAIVGIGGGRTLDVAKWVGTRLGVPTVSVATSLAHDGVASPVSVLEHRTRKGSYGVQIPLAVVVDTDFVRRSDVAVTRAGVGDVLSNLSAIADWELAHTSRGEPKDGLAIAMARTAATAVLECPGTPTDDSFLRVLGEAIVMSGLAMAAAGSSRPCSGACHEISHSLDELVPGRPSRHGEQAALGALYATFLRGDGEGFGQLRRVMLRHGLPVRPEDIGSNEEEFIQAVVQAPATRPERYTILEAANLDEDAARRSVKEFLSSVDAGVIRPVTVNPGR